jgi:RNA polymerase sigma-70 factor, ECF subfamily
VIDPLPTDDALLADARAGTPSAIEALLERYQARVFAFGLRMCGNAEDARDVLQETLLAAARTVSDFRGDSSVPTWLYTIARSFCIKARRRSKFAPSEEVSLDREGRTLASSVPGPEELAAGGEVKRALAQALEALDQASREVVILRDIEGMTAAEVAKVTSSSVDAVKSRLHRARVAVRERLATTLGDAPPPRAPGCPDVLAAFSQQLEGDLEPRLCAELQGHIDRLSRHCPCSRLGQLPPSPGIAEAQGTRSRPRGRRRYRSCRVERQPPARPPDSRKSDSASQIASPRCGRAGIPVERRPSAS